MGSQQTFRPTPSLITIPNNYPSEPTPGKLQILWEDNAKKLYRRLSPYANYHQGLVGGLTEEPYFYTFIDEAGKGVSGLKKYESRLFPAGSAPIDVVRTAKFLGSGRGIIFLGKQFLLQSGNAYNETRIYNPTSPLVAAGMGLAIGTVRPQRNFDTSAGLLGLASTLIGNKIPDAIFGAPKTNPPSGTIETALPDATLTTGGKGLLRAGTANRALSHLQAAWPQNVKGSSNNSTFKSVVAGLAKSIFGNYLPQNQNNFKVRSDEGAYGLMVGAGATKFKWSGPAGDEKGFGQRWVAGGKDIRKTGQYPSRPYRVFGGANGKGVEIINDNVQPRNLKDVGEVGYTIEESSDKTKPGYRYGDNLGINVDPNYGASDVMLSYASYTVERNQYPTKLTEPSAVEKVNTTLTSVLDKLKKVSNGIYLTDIPADARVISSGEATKEGYDRLFATAKKHSSPKNYPLGVLQDYRETRNVDNTLTNNSADNSLKLPTAGHFDAINTLTVLGRDQKVPNNLIAGWTKWNPYVDDQIAFFFYDVVNEKYIPFRAAIKGVNENSTATWEEMPVIGRGDKVYSYAGFNRNMSFGLKIVINSLAELAPTWQRINYLMTLVKPANYTRATVNSTVNRFMVPPMVMLTMGDLYKDQPILIQSVGMSIPDDASWETQNEFNSQEWAYLATYMKGGTLKYGQLPREIELNIGVILLEKERAIVGGANFGHAPRTEDWLEWNTESVPNGGVPNKLHKALVVDVTNVSEQPALLDAGTPFDNTINQNVNVA